MIKILYIYIYYQIIISLKKVIKYYRYEICYRIYRIYKKKYLLIIGRVWDSFKYYYKKWVVEVCHWLKKNFNI